MIFLVIMGYYLYTCPKKSGEVVIPAKLEYLPGIPLCAYLMLYSIGRFIIEYFRDDPRGNVGMLTTSQFIAMFTFAAGIGYLIILLWGSKEKDHGSDNDQGSEA